MKLRKRALMEANNNNKGGEIRRVHVIYFLSRMGHVDQPHLIRVHHLTGGGGGGAGGGVYLRDVKRWLGELRGKDMAEAFSWSYKRKYKRGYVWQDLVDDELITPISDNEYVLQGSQLITTPHLIPTSFREEEEGKKKDEDLPAKGQMNNNVVESPPCNSERSTVTDDGDSTNNLETAKRGIEEEEEIEGFKKTQYSSLYAKLVNIDKDKDSMEKQGGLKATSTVSSSSSSSTSSSSHHSSFTKSKSYSTVASNVLRQWIMCGAVDTNDVVLIKNRSPKDLMNQLPSEKSRNDAMFCRDVELGGSARIIKSSWDESLEIRRQHSPQSSRKSFDNSKKKRPKESGGRKVADTVATYKPIAGPNCLLCGKTFRPEKMHSHMKSCRGLKSLTKTASTSDKTTSSKSTTTTSDKDSTSTSTYLLTN